MFVPRLGSIRDLDGQQENPGIRGWRGRVPICLIPIWKDSGGTLRSRLLGNSVRTRERFIPCHIDFTYAATNNLHITIPRYTMASRQAQWFKSAIQPNTIQVHKLFRGVINESL
jgi:hypothetical protein